MSDRQTRLNAFGDSITASHSVDPLTELYVQKTADYFGYKLVNNAVSVNMAADQGYLTYFLPPPTDSDIYSICLGVNDADTYGNTADKRTKGFVPYERGLIAWNALPLKQTALQMSRTGTWTKTTVNPIGMNATNTAHTATGTFRGDALYVFATLHNNAGSEGAANIVVDGADQGAVLLNGTSVGSTALGLPYSLACWRFAGLGAGAHTVVITTINVNTFFLDAIAGSEQPFYPKVFVGDVSFRGNAQYNNGNSDANVTAYCGEIDTIVSNAQTDGLKVYPFEVNSVVDKTTELVDGIHWNATAHNDVYLNLRTAIQAAS